jgi:hypothetical protein
MERVLGRALLALILCYTRLNRDERFGRRSGIAILCRVALVDRNIESFVMDLLPPLVCAPPSYGYCFYAVGSLVYTS